MKQNKKITQVLSVLLAVLLTLNLAAPMAHADEESTVVHIASMEDWKQLVRQCRMDSWSTGITVVLDQDIVLPKDASIPIFGGTFDGCGHTLKHLALTDEGDHQGLFRYLQAGGVIQNLTVSGTVTPSGDAVSVGGLVGSNSGTVKNCTFVGAVAGTDTVGGIVGVNQAEGRIVDCTMQSGAVSGEHYTGGIVGDNRGAVIHCVNRAQINTQAIEPTPDLEDIDLEKLNRVENLPSCTDSGGIAGYSGGLLQSCTNFGTVGYPHMGYNVGGIAGRQMGQMIDCSNSGSIRGRKDVGGVVGQAEPFTELKYQEDTLKKLARELDNLSSLMNSALDSTDDTRHAISDHLTTISGHADSAQSNVSDLLDELESVGDQTVDVANDLSGRVRDFMDDMERVTGGMEKASDRLTDGLRTMREAARKAGSAQGPLENAANDFEQSLATLKKTIEDLAARIPAPYAPGDPPVIPEISKEDLEELETAILGIQDLIRICQGIAESGFGDALDQMTDASNHLTEAGQIVQSTLKIMEDALWELSRSSNHMSSAFGDLTDAINAQNELPQLELPKLSPEFHETEGALRESMTSLTDELERMNQTANLGGDVLSDQMKQVNHQFNVITNVLRHAGDEFDNPDLVVDVSDDALNDVTVGRLQSCRNDGDVAGDVNIGGVVGSMAIELDFDPEDDVQKNGNKSMKFQYLTRAVVHSCTNRGSITARKDCAGGIVGRMDLGIVVNAQSYGRIESTNGEEVGGIAGRSDAIIRDSWAKCSLSAQRKVGGIAGIGTDIQGCRSLVKIEDGASRLGAIAGDAEGIVSRNVFVSNTLGGVDGVSYEGKARPVSWEEFLNIEDIPQDFRALTLNFYDEDGLMKTVNVPFGQPIPPEDIPKVPAKPCCYGAWEDFDEKCVTFDQEIHAVYTPWLSSVSSTDGNILAEGAFEPDTRLVTKELETLPTVEGRKICAGWSVQLEDTDGEFTALRVKLPEKVHSAELWVTDSDGVWTALSTTTESSYLRAEWTGTDTQVIVVKAQPNMTLVILVVGLVLLAIFLLVNHHKAKGGKPKQAKPKKEKKEKKEKRHG